MGQRAKGTPLGGGQLALFWLVVIGVALGAAQVVPRNSQLLVLGTFALAATVWWLLHGIRHRAAVLARGFTALVTAGVMVVSLWPSPSPTLEAPPSRAAEGSAPPTDEVVESTESTPVTTPTPSLVPNSVPHSSCPTPGGSTSPELITIRVVYWCFGDVISDAGDYVDTQRQIKVRLGLTNASETEMNVSTTNPSRIRLVIAGEDVDGRWAPRGGTLSAGDRPTPVVIDGQSFWAVPPNINYDERGVPSVGLYTGFSSKWDLPALLAPGVTIGGGTEIGDGSATYSGPDAVADLVFQVPVNGYTAPVEVLGIAVFSIPDGSVGSQDWVLLGLCEFEDWGPQLASMYF